MSWQPTDPFSGTSISYDFGAQSAAAEQLKMHAADAQKHGATLTEHTQRPVGSGYYGTIVNGAVGRMFSAIGTGLTGAFQGFYHDTAGLLEHTAGETKTADAGTKGSFDAIADHHFSGSPVDHHFDYHAAQATVVGTSDVGTIKKNFAAALKDPVVGPMVAGTDPFPKTPEQFMKDHWDPNANRGQGGHKWPENGGAVPGTVRYVTLDRGSLWSRLGPLTGTYASPFGTKLGARAVPSSSVGPAKNNFDHSTIEVLEPFTVPMSIVDEAFGQPGGGVQAQMQPSIEFLAKLNIVKVHSP